MSEFTQQLTEVEPPAMDEMCGCGRPKAHFGMCKARGEKAAATRRAKRQTGEELSLKREHAQFPLIEASQPVIAYYHLHCEGDHIKVQLTGGSVDDLKELLITLGNALGFTVQVR